MSVELEAFRKLGRPVTLAEIRKAPALAEVPLIRHTRLSVMPLTRAQFDAICGMGG